jgi:hypothetical protein
MIRLAGLVDLAPSLSEDGKWIQKAIKHPGALHKQLHVPQGEKIPAEKLAAAAKHGGKLGKRARLAQTLRKLKHEYKLTEDQTKKIDEMLEALSGDNAAMDAMVRDENSSIQEALGDEESNDGQPSNANDHEGNMARAQLMTLSKQSSELFNMIGEEEGLEAWVQDKLGKASDYINTVYNFMQYEKHKHDNMALGAGKGYPADTNKSNQKF